MAKGIDTGKGGELQPFMQSFYHNLNMAGPILHMPTY